MVDADGFRHFLAPGEPVEEPGDGVDDERWRAAARQLAEDYTTALGSDLRRSLS